ncbi:MAG: PilW family protein [Planctomycetota bacterium]|jgi:type II secretory pathway pseudopilin PulG
MQYPKNKIRASTALTLLEMVIALAIMATVFAAILPLFRSIQNSWDSKQAAAETVQNGRVLIDHLNRNLAKAVKITAVTATSDLASQETFQTSQGRPANCSLPATMPVISVLRSRISTISVS